MKQKFKLRRRPRNKTTVLIECIEGGIRGGLVKAGKWAMSPEPSDELVRLVAGYVLANLEEEFQL